MHSANRSLQVNGDYVIGPLYDGVPTYVKDEARLPLPLGMRRETPVR
jgi:hypothetical protein